MLIGDNFVYIELHKTGCSHTRKILEAIPSLEAKGVGKHNTYDTVRKEILGDFEAKLKIGNIRNPWDWYVSLWAFGCTKQKGGIYNRATYSPNLFTKKGLKVFIKYLFLDPKFLFQNRKEWRTVYKDSKNPDLFRRWLKLLMKNQSLYVGNNFRKSSFASFIGLLTVRYVQLYHYKGLDTLAKAKKFEELEGLDGKNNFMDIVIRNESINDCLLANADKMGLSKDELMAVFDQYKERTNTSVRNDYRYYYDDETIALVKEKEKLIIQKYGYEY